MIREEGRFWKDTVQRKKKRVQNRIKRKDNEREGGGKRKREIGIVSERGNTKIC